MIIHIYRECPNENFDAYNENGKFVGSELRLSAFRNIFEVKIHRGFHSDESKIPSPVSHFRDTTGKPLRGVTVYWFEIKAEAQK